VRIVDRRERGGRVVEAAVCSVRPRADLQHDPTARLGVLGAEPRGGRVVHEEVLEAERPERAPDADGRRFSAAGAHLLVELPHAGEQLPFDGRAPRVVVQPERLLGGQAAQPLGQLVRRGHRGLVDQYREDGNAAFEGDLQLVADEIRRVVETAIPVVIADVRPRGPDERDDHVGASERLLDDQGVVGARRDRVGVLEHLFLAELVREGVVEAVGAPLGVAAPVVEEDLRLGHHAPT